jgi:hypothetical protein
MWTAWGIGYEQLLYCEKLPQKWTRTAKLIYIAEVSANLIKKHGLKLMFAKRVSTLVLLNFWEYNWKFSRRRDLEFMRERAWYNSRINMSSRINVFFLYYMSRNIYLLFLLRIKLRDALYSDKKAVVRYFIHNIEKLILLYSTKLIFFLKAIYLSYGCALSIQMFIFLKLAFGYTCLLYADVFDDVSNAKYLYAHFCRLSKNTINGIAHFRRKYGHLFKIGRKCVDYEYQRYVFFKVKLRWDSVMNTRITKDFKSVVQHALIKNSATQMKISQLYNYKSVLTLRSVWEEINSFKYSYSIFLHFFNLWARVKHFNIVRVLFLEVFVKKNMYSFRKRFRLWRTIYGLIRNVWRKFVWRKRRRYFLRKTKRFRGKKRAKVYKNRLRRFKKRNRHFVSRVRLYDVRTRFRLSRMYILFNGIAFKRSIVKAFGLKHLSLKHIFSINSKDLFESYLSIFYGFTLDFFISYCKNMQIKYNVTKFKDLLFFLEYRVEMFFRKFLCTRFNSATRVTRATFLGSDIIFIGDIFMTEMLFFEKYYFFFNFIYMIDQLKLREKFSIISLMYRFVYKHFHMDYLYELEFRNGVRSLALWYTCVAYAWFYLKIDNKWYSYVKSSVVVNLFFKNFWTIAYKDYYCDSEYLLYKRYFCGEYKKYTLISYNGVFTLKIARPYKARWLAARALDWCFIEGKSSSEYVLKKYKSYQWQKKKWEIYKRTRPARKIKAPKYYHGTLYERNRGLWYVLKYMALNAKRNVAMQKFSNIVDRKSYGIWRWSNNNKIWYNFKYRKMRKFIRRVTRRKKSTLTDILLSSFYTNLAGAGPYMLRSRYGFSIKNII